MSNTGADVPKREPGYYWVRNQEYWKVARFSHHHFVWHVTGSLDTRDDDNFDEIDERRIERGDAPSKGKSHTPEEHKIWTEGYVAGMARERSRFAERDNRIAALEAALWEVRGQASAFGLHRTVVIIDKILTPKP